MKNIRKNRAASLIRLYRFLILIKCFSNQREEQHNDLSKEDESGMTNTNLKTILVVDDETVVRRIARKFLEKEGYNVLEARDGREAVDFVSQCGDKIDLVLLDMKMPFMDGYATFPKLKNLNPDLKIIICTAYMTNWKTQQILESGAAGYMEKPYSFRKLMELIHSVLS